MLGIDISHGFTPTYEVTPDKESVVTQLQKAASTADAVYLAGDPYREGEAICQHLADVLSGPKLEFLTEEQKAEEANGNGKKGKKKAKKPAKPVKKAVAKGKPVIARKNIFRVMFNEITSKAIKAAFEASRRDQTSTWWTRSRRAACWTAWSVTKFHRSCGTKCAAASPLDACKPSRCA